MGASFGDLDPRQMDRLRIELAEALCANVAYPPFFDYRAGTTRIRPVDRAKRDEIDIYLRSVNFEPLARVDLTSPEVRRFFERLLLRYIEVNPALAQPRLTRRLPDLRSRVPRMAAEVHRGLLALRAGEPSGASFGARRKQPSWADSAATSPAAPTRQSVQPRPAGERNTRVLEAILVRQEFGGLPAQVSSPLPPAAPPAPKASPASRPPAPVAPVIPAASAPVPEPPPAWLLGNVGSGDLTVPVPAQGWPPPSDSSPFAGLESGAQSAVFGPVTTIDDVRAIPDRPTGPLPVPPAARSAASGALPAEAAPSAPRELPPDLYQLYGDYLRDMEPEVEPPPASAPLPVPPAPASASAVSRPVAPPTTEPPSVNGTRGYPAAPAQAAPAPIPSPLPPAPSPDDARSDKLIFWQLRYQLEAYVRRAAQSYGVHGSSDDPFSILDALRRSRFVDEADLRIAEGILALTDRVTASGAASVEDYRQAFLLYLLYHRSHLGV